MMRILLSQMSKRFYILLLPAYLFLAALMLSFSNKPMSEVQLGQKLFFDPILSADRSIHCASCHKPELAFADSVSFSHGVNGRLATRNTPSVMNMAMRDVYFWDGRAASLEEQVRGPIENPNEMNLPFREAVVRLQASAEYRALFRQVYHHMPDSASLLRCIAAYERTLETDQTPSDRWLNDLPGGLTASEIRGRELFLSPKTHCFDCHYTPDFTADEFKNIGLFNGQSLNDSGRYLITHKPQDIGKFKVPGLRNVSVTAPYMHNGMFKTLKEVIEYYDDPARFVPNSINRDTTLLKPIGLTSQEKLDLEAYLIALTDDRFVPSRKK